LAKRGAGNVRVIAFQCAEIADISGFNLIFIRADRAGGTVEILVEIGGPEFPEA
jgi:hypothetical protein